MRISPPSSPPRRRTPVYVGLALAWGALWLGAAAPAGALAQSSAPAQASVAVLVEGPASMADVQAGSSSPTTPRPDAAATLEQCLTSGAQAERSATFAGEMNAIPGSARMEMRIEVLERLPTETTFHAVVAPGLGVWRSAAAGVKVFRFLKQVTNLSAPAVYRGAVLFRWLGDKGRPIKDLELRTPRCRQTVPAPAPAPTDATTPTTGALAGPLE